jgi:hypothetical protein
MCLFGEKFLIFVGPVPSPKQNSAKDTGERSRIHNYDNDVPGIVPGCVAMNHYRHPFFARPFQFAHHALDSELMDDESKKEQNWRCDQ